MISSVFPGEIPGRSRLALLGRRGFPLSGSVTGKADRGLVTKVNLFYNGKSNRDIGQELVITESTVRRHVSNIYDKIGVSNRTEAARYALREGLALEN